LYLSSLELTLQQRRLDRHVIKNGVEHGVSELSPSQRKILGSAGQNYRFFVEVIIGWHKCSRFEEYLAEHGKMSICKIVKTTSGRCEGHKKSHSIEVKRMQKYVNAHTFIFV